MVAGHSGTMIVDKNGQAWWIDPDNRSMRPAFPDGTGIAVH